jgi:hypothetical protein
MVDKYLFHQWRLCFSYHISISCDCMSLNGKWCSLVCGFWFIFAWLAFDYGYKFFVLHKGLAFVEVSNLEFLVIGILNSKSFKRRFKTTLCGQYDYNSINILSINEKIKSTCKQYTWCVQTTNHVLHLVNSTNPSSPNHSHVFHISNHKFIVGDFQKIHYKMSEMLSELVSYFLVAFKMCEESKMKNTNTWWTFPQNVRPKWEKLTSHEHSSKMWDQIKKTRSFHCSLSPYLLT